MHEVDVSAARLCWLWRRRDGRLFSAPGAKNIFDRLQHGGGIEITDHQEQRVLRRVKIAIDREEIVTLVGSDLFFCRRDLRVRVRAEKDSAEALARQEPGLRGVEVHFFDLL